MKSGPSRVNAPLGGLRFQGPRGVFTASMKKTFGMMIILDFGVLSSFFLIISHGVTVTVLDFSQGWAFTLGVRRAALMYCASLAAKSLTYRAEPTHGGRPHPRALLPRFPGADPKPAMA